MLSRRFLLPLLGCALLMCGGCPNDQLPVTTPPPTTLTFSSSLVYTPVSPAVGTIITFSFTVADNTTNNTALSNVPWTLVHDGTVNFLSGTIVSIAANGTATVTFNIQETVSGSHTYTVIVDPNNTTGVIDQTTNNQTVTIGVSPDSFG